MHRRQLLQSTLAMLLAAPTLTRAQSPLAKGVVIAFPPPLPMQPRLTAALQARFSGPYKPDNISGGTALEALERAALRAALGPDLDKGAFTYGLLTTSESVLFDPLREPKSRIKPNDLRAAYLLGTPPWVLGAGRGLKVRSIPELHALAYTRNQAGSPIVIHVSAGLGAQFGNGLAQLFGTKLIRDITYGTLQPEKFADNPDSELFVLPLSPRLLARAAEGKLRILSALTTSREALLAAGQSMSVDTTQIAHLPKEFDSLDVPRTLGLFVSNREQEATVRALYSACVEAFAEPGELNDFYFPLPEANSLSGVGKIEQRIRLRFKALSVA